jgi:phosphomevalonate kinase
MVKNLSQRLGGGRQITIKGDNDYYSQRENLSSLNLSLSLDSLMKLPRFSSLGCKIGQVHKTGLGSSAAMMTSLIGALCVNLGLCVLPDTVGQTLVHNLTQFCHCLAQGKIGSGFDVSSAVYGTHVYQRFSPVVLEQALVNAEAGNLSAASLKEVVIPSVK